jgi:hypothetical protein
LLARIVTRTGTNRGEGAERRFRTAAQEPVHTMKYKTRIPILLALVAVGALIAYFPPGSFTWHRFFADESSAKLKLVYLFKIYAVPFCLSFAAVVLFQLQMRTSVGGAPPLSVLGSISMLGAFRSMVAGIGGVPGYAVGMAAAYTMMSRYYGIKPSGRTLFGKPMVKIVWRGDPEAAAARRQLQAAGRYPPSPQFNVSSNTSNS